jgi:hypothetical protein
MFGQDVGDVGTRSGAAVEVPLGVELLERGEDGVAGDAPLGGETAAILPSAGH